MSRLTKEEHDEILRGILGDGDLTPEMEDFMDRLRKDFDESLVVDEKEANEDVENKGDKEVDYKEKYETLKERYKERFFTSPEEVKKEQEEDVKNDSESDKKEYKELFKEREG